MKNSKVFKFSIALLLGISIIGTFSGCSSKETKGEAVNVRVGYFPNITHAQALVGRDQGTFQKAIGASNKIDWKLFNAGPAEVEALFAGAIDIGYIGPGPAINAYVKSKGDVQIIAGATDAGAIFVSRKGIVIKNLKDLSGKKIAVPQFGNTQDLTLRKILSDNGLKDKTKGGTVEVRQAANADILALLQKGDIDAALVPEPWGSRLIKEASANIILDYKDVFREGKYTAVVVVRTEFLKDHPQIVEDFIKNHVATTEYINKNPDKAKEIVNKQITELTKKSIANDVLDAAFKRLTITNDPEKDSVLDFVKSSVKEGFLKSEPDTKDLFNITILNKILKENGLAQIK
ncbi:aliphatic sulfonate ABC transporter substrate-binding protein [Clostridium estertheticum]|uniref:aliphatic sulfonate ABC transporter substrate-binding protein n=1 Tax=Clostridium estertheticum TaxID=238834 RepID=UPI001CF3241A|nr:aliphatic sulfonate ABC transporter substrate-binding protein [Clostridium estertheticum]MCB2306885.1 aliphatic sulfonate ABC transporter substrate-binding protein [Clostridium estertheticum]MCB2345326.1 aliphatic sulfonate ABC transporter substrate-binding protein [Clostridium estertheticum]MCB2350391.1 aliphatic sulfonate ABC transporter substrate-binding protein [Clostridium estertheticum]WAG45213.1 aliphatic sulfonate ABC transporter substrate-binding protein [Clostridium estertheticum]